MLYIYNQIANICEKSCWKCKIWHYSFVSLLFSHWRPLLIHFHSIITSLSLNCAFVIVVLLLFLIRLLVCYFGTESWKSPLALKSCKICNPRAHLSQDPVPTKICCHGNNIRPAPVHERPKAPPLLLNRFVFEDPKNNVTHVNALSMAQCWALQCYLLSIHPSSGVHRAPEVQGETMLRGHNREPGYCIGLLPLG